MLPAPIPGQQPKQDPPGENPLGEPSESDAPEMKGSKLNPLKAWANNKLMGAAKR